MGTVKLKHRRLVGLVLLLIVIYALVSPRKYTSDKFVELPDARPIDVWEFVADFSNMKYLNPTIIDFKVTEESGNYEHWSYAAEYEERLSHWPYLTNVNVGRFDVYKKTSAIDAYRVSSTHLTCLLFGLVCTQSHGNFNFTLHPNGRKKDVGTIVHESVEYECSPLLYWFCRREVSYQRDAIASNLHTRFQ